MAYAISQSNITSDQLRTIQAMLHLQPANTGMFTKDQPPPAPISFWHQEGDIYHLPFLFAAALFKINPNLDLPFTAVNLHMTGSLLERQIPVEAEAWQQLQTYGTSILGLYPGFGKTILGACLAVRAGLLTAVLVHRELLTAQWKQTFEKFTNARVWIVGQPPPPVCDVIICMDTRWDRMPDTFRSQIGFLIIDEAHAFCTPSHVQCLLAFHPKFILAESASLIRDDGMHDMIHAICGSHGVHRESNKPFEVIKVTTNTRPERKLTRQQRVNWTALVNATLMDERRNYIIRSLVQANLGRKILILTSLVEHALLLHNALTALGISCDYLCATKKSYQDGVVLVGTVSKIGTGFDQASFCGTYAGRPFDLLILACSLKKQSMLVQNIGRCFRSDYPTIMHLVDDDNIFKNHWTAARKWYLLHGGTISYYEVPNLQNTTAAPVSVNQTQQQWIANKTKQ